MDMTLLDEYCSRLADDKICIADDIEFAKMIDAVIEGDACLSRLPIEKRRIESGGK